MVSPLRGALAGAEGERAQEAVLRDQREEGVGGDAEVAYPGERRVVGGLNVLCDERAPGEGDGAGVQRRELVGIGLDRHALHAQHAAFEHREQADGARADNGNIGAVRAAWGVFGEFVQFHVVDMQGGGLGCKCFIDQDKLLLFCHAGVVPASRLIVGSHFVYQRDPGTRPG